MTLESAMQVENVTPTPDYHITETDNRNGKYTQEQFQRDLAKAQTEEISIGRKDPMYAAPEPTELSDVSNVEIPQEDNNIDETPTESHEVETRVDDDDDDIGHGPIPKKRFNKEIEKRKVLEEQLNREREERIKAQATIDMYNRALEEASKPKHEQTRDIDPIDNDAHQYYVKEINELKAQLNQQNEHLNHEKQQQTINQVLLAQRAEFMARKPDFDKAYNHVFEAEVRSNELMGMDKAEAMRFADQKLMERAVQGLKVGKDVPAMLYETAKAYGYNPKQPANAVKPTGPNLKAIEKNILKSDSILNDLNEVSSRPAPAATAYVSNDGFARHLMNKDGRGVDADAFHKALEKLRNGM